MFRLVQEHVFRVKYSKVQVVIVQILDALTYLKKDVKSNLGVPEGQRLYQCLVGCFQHRVEVLIQVEGGQVGLETLVAQGKTLH